MKLIFVCVLSIFFVAACSTAKIEITNTYIINENWSKKNDEVGGNSMWVTKMKVKKDSTLNPYAPWNEREILNKLEVDSTFFYYTNVRIAENESYKNKKIYFNQDNGFEWGSDIHNNKGKVRTIGDLQPGTWYRFYNLALIYHPYYIYIFIDSTNKAHRLDKNLSNY